MQGKSGEADFDLAAQKENDNLRIHLRWCLSRLPEEDRRQLQARMGRPIARGGVTDDEGSPVGEFERLRTCAVQLAAHVEPLLRAERLPDNRHWYGRLDHLLEQVNGFEPKHPIMARVAGQPNVFKPVKFWKDEG